MHLAAKEMTVDTIFDLASLSKSVGCAMSIMVLVDQGKLRVTDPISAQYLPA
jgi:CubicO group peptidase (beta-lactamase class C family)